LKPFDGVTMGQSSSEGELQEWEPSSHTTSKKGVDEPRDFERKKEFGWGKKKMELVSRSREEHVDLEHGTKFRGSTEMRMSERKRKGQTSLTVYATLAI